jgi:hypothetical protein
VGVKSHVGQARDLQVAPLEGTVQPHAVAYLRKCQHPASHRDWEPVLG